MPDPRVLIVEDELIVSLEIEHRLQSLAYQVVATATNGQAAIQKALDFRPDLILMDIRLKGEIDGISAAQQIQAQLNIPIIYLTAYTDDETLQRAKITEPFGYVVKPFRERDLQVTIELALYKHQAEQARQQLQNQLADSLKALKVLSGILPICSVCKKIRDQDDHWHTLEAYIRAHSEADFSHGLCPDCARKTYPEFFEDE